MAGHQPAPILGVGQTPQSDSGGDPGDVIGSAQALVAELSVEGGYHFENTSMAICTRYVYRAVRRDSKHIAVKDEDTDTDIEPN